MMMVDCAMHKLQLAVMPWHVGLAAQSDDLWCGSRQEAKVAKRPSVIGCAAESGRAGYWRMIGQKIAVV